MPAAARSVRRRRPSSSAFGVHLVAMPCARTGAHFILVTSHSCATVLFGTQAEAIDHWRARALCAEAAVANSGQHARSPAAAPAPLAGQSSHDRQLALESELASCHRIAEKALQIVAMLKAAADQRQVEWSHVRCSTAALLQTCAVSAWHMQAWMPCRCACVRKQSFVLSRTQCRGGFGSTGCCPGHSFHVWICPERC